MTNVPLILPIKSYKFRVQVYSLTNDDVKKLRFARLHECMECVYIRDWRIRCYGCLSSYYLQLEQVSICLDNDSGLSINKMDYFYLIVCLLYTSRCV